MRHSPPFSTPFEALIYLADCSAGTCELMSMRKSMKAKSEFDRQVSITRIALDSAKQFQGDSNGGYLESVTKRLDDAINAQKEKMRKV